MNPHPNGSDLADSSPATPIEQDAAIHPTAARTAFPKGIEVDGANGSTKYTEEEILARYVNRGAEVSSQSASPATPPALDLPDFSPSYSPS